jgi:hypothetical protein
MEVARLEAGRKAKEAEWKWCEQEHYKHEPKPSLRLSPSGSEDSTDKNRAEQTGDRNSKDVLHVCSICIKDRRWQSRRIEGQL